MVLVNWHTFLVHQIHNLLGVPILSGSVGILPVCEVRSLDEVVDDDVLCGQAGCRFEPIPTGVGFLDGGSLLAGERGTGASTGTGLTGECDLADLTGCCDYTGLTGRCFLAVNLEFGVEGKWLCGGSFTSFPGSRICWRRS